MSRLHAKGLLARERAGRAFAYRPVDEASVTAERMSQALYTGRDHDAVLAKFASGLSGRDARLLRGLLAGAPDPGGNGSEQVQILVFIPLLMPALAAAAARPLAAQLEPRQATWLLTAAGHPRRIQHRSPWPCWLPGPLPGHRRWPRSGTTPRRRPPRRPPSRRDRRRSRAGADRARRGHRARPPAAGPGAGRVLPASGPAAPGHRLVVVTSPDIEAYALPGGPGRSWSPAAR